MSEGHNLPRLDRSLYRGFAVVFWTHTLAGKEEGWLSDRFHSDFRELLLHTGARESIFCPAYCLMPDHFHVVWMGMRLSSDQLNATMFLRKQINRLLSGQELVPRLATGTTRSTVLQQQAHDHILRREERQRDAFAKVCFYTLENPVRAELIDEARNWKFSGAVVPGYPTLWPFNEDFWPIFWKLYEQQREPDPQPSS